MLDSDRPITKFSGLLFLNNDSEGSDGSYQSVMLDLCVVFKHGSHADKLAVSYTEKHCSSECILKHLR